jgi:hypothetical protein
MGKAHYHILATLYKCVFHAALRTHNERLGPEATHHLLEPVGSHLLDELVR